MCMYIFVNRVFSYKETISSGTLVGRTADTAACAMPNLIRRRMVCRRLPPAGHPHGCGHRCDALRRNHCAPWRQGACGHGARAPYVAGFFRRRQRRVRDADVMRAAMRKAASLGKLIAAHCEDNTLLHGGYIHDGAYAPRPRAQGHQQRGEWRQLERDLELVRETGCAYHMCHVSARRVWRSSAGRRRRGWTSPARPHRTTSC